MSRFKRMNFRLLHKRKKMTVSNEEEILRIMEENEKYCNKFNATHAKKVKCTVVFISKEDEEICMNKKIKRRKDGKKLKVITNASALDVSNQYRKLGIPFSKVNTQSISNNMTAEEYIKTLKGDHTAIYASEQTESCLSILNDETSKKNYRTSDSNARNCEQLKGDVTNKSNPSSVASPNSACNYETDSDSDSEQQQDDMANESNTSSVTPDDACNDSTDDDSGCEEQEESAMANGSNSSIDTSDSACEDRTDGDSRGCEQKLKGDMTNKSNSSITTLDETANCLNTLIDDTSKGDNRTNENLNLNSVDIKSVVYNLTKFAEEISSETTVMQNNGQTNKQVHYTECDRNGSANIENGRNGDSDSVQNDESSDSDCIQSDGNCDSDNTQGEEKLDRDSIQKDDNGYSSSTEDDYWRNSVFEFFI